MRWLTGKHGAASQDNFGRYLNSDIAHKVDARRINHEPVLRDQRGKPSKISTQCLVAPLTTSLPCRHMKGEFKEEALEQLAILVGAEHVDDVAEKFKVRVPSSPSNSLQTNPGVPAVVHH